MTNTFDFAAYRREELAHVRPITVRLNDDSQGRPFQIVLQFTEHQSSVFDVNEGELRALRDAINGRLGGVLRYRDPGMIQHESYCHLQHGRGGRCTCGAPEA